MTLRLLGDWCREMDVNSRKAPVVAGVPPWGSTDSSGHRPRGDEVRNVALIGLTEETSLALVPKEISGGGDSEFLSRLNELLEGEGEFTRALALQPALQHLKYKKLKVFSGSDPPEPEEEFESWLRRLLESFRDPASSIICVLQINNPLITTECLQALGVAGQIPDRLPEGGRKFRCLLEQPRNTAQAGFLELLTLIKDEEAAEEEEDALLQAGLEGHFT
ncbi:hypothetical protein FD755_018987 [Muntiacus reevesi]|uniref:Uncharacterized protein n=1 Tax=Muntiacus reevesi TaxID=9886 RepID=A0A5N3X526_MUNRE|nr:hypothetical protein FD755_018987 [Muntiacus reevesi]